MNDDDCSVGFNGIHYNDTFCFQSSFCRQNDIGNGNDIVFVTENKKIIYYPY